MNRNLVIILFIIQYLTVVYTKTIDKRSLDEDIQQNEVYYPGIGYFKTHDFYHPENRPIVFLPESPEQINTRFFLYTRKNLNNSQVLKFGDYSAIASSFFDGKHETKVIVPGFLDNQLSCKWINDMKDKWLTIEDFNVIVVDWSGGNGLPYEQATVNARVVGAVIGSLLNYLETATELNLKNVHILGHSLGAHVAGYAGQRLNGKVGRITGLEPAGRYFEGLKLPAAKLDPTDALFVDAIHANAHHINPHLVLGMNETSGHLDFYPNGGKEQPGCNEERWISNINKGLKEGFQRFLGCSHMRSIHLYMTSINRSNNKGLGFLCKDYESFLKGQCYAECGTSSQCATLGEDADLNSGFAYLTKGTRFFLRTTDKYPYFIHIYKIMVTMPELENDWITNTGHLTVTLRGENGQENVKLKLIDQNFHPGRSYSFVANVNKDLGVINIVIYRWDKLLANGKIFIESITVEPISSKNLLNKELHLKEIKTFCKNCGPERIVMQGRFITIEFDELKI